jgi:hypothetical protein
MPWWCWQGCWCFQMKAPTKNSDERMKTTPATITTQAAAV